jgi:nicotinamide-nucleotide amidase
MQAILATGVLPMLRRRFPAAPRPTATVRSFGISESAIAERVEPWAKRNPRVEFSYYPSTNGVDVVLRGESRAAVLRGQKRVTALLSSRVYAVGEESLEAVLGRLLMKRRLTLATAESCTGGMVAGRITNAPGSSKYYIGSIVSYANDVKVSLLGVGADTLRKYGAVSSQTAEEMAVGVCRLTGANVGIAVTGVAGPGGGSARKPVGTVCIHVKLGRRHAAETLRLSGNRAQVRERAASAALDLCRRTLERAA